MKFRKRQVLIEATQWLRHGDHPFVEELPNHLMCKAGQRKKFGWLKTSMADEGHIVTPGDWIITHENGQFSSCNPFTFARIYEPETAQPNLPSQNGSAKSA